MFNGYLPKEVIGLKLPTEDNTGNRVIQQSLVYDFLSGLCQTLHIRIFNKSDNLKSCCFEMLEITGHLKCRSIYIRLCNLNLLDVDLRSEILQILVLNNVR